MSKKRKQITFDRFGKCLICRQPFKSERCSHDYSYVHNVVQAANSNFSRDVRKLRQQQH